MKASCSVMSEQRCIMQLKYGADAYGYGVRIKYIHVRMSVRRPPAILDMHDGLKLSYASIRKFSSPKLHELAERKCLHAAIGENCLSRLAKIAAAADKFSAKRASRGLSHAKTSSGVKSRAPINSPCIWIGPSIQLVCGFEDASEAVFLPRKV